MGGTTSLAQIAGLYSLSTKGGKLSAKVSTGKVCKAAGQSIKGVAPGTCKGTLTIKRTKGKSVRKVFSFAVTK